MKTVVDVVYNMSLENYYQYLPLATQAEKELLEKELMSYINNNNRTELSEIQRGNLDVGVPYSDVLNHLIRTNDKLNQINVSLFYRLFSIDYFSNVSFKSILKLPKGSYAYLQPSVFFYTETSKDSLTYLIAFLCEKFRDKQEFNQLKPYLDLKLCERCLPNSESFKEKLHIMNSILKEKDLHLKVNIYANKEEDVLPYLTFTEFTNITPVYTIA